MLNYSEGLVSQIDKVGRIVIDIGIRKSMNLKKGDYLYFSCKASKIILSTEGNGVGMKLDTLGRIVIPISIRKQFGLTYHSNLYVIPKARTIILRPYSQGCAICGKSTNLIPYGDILFCDTCIENLYNLKQLIRNHQLSERKVV